MKQITCDLCKRMLGVTVDTAGWRAMTMPQMGISSFSTGIESMDLCTECSNAIADAQNKCIEGLRK